jgi:hypothetical protein
MLGVFVAAALALIAQPKPPAATPAPQQPPEAPTSLWRPADDHITFTTANIDVPRAPGAVHFTRSFEFSHPGEGLDTGLQFQSADGQVFATVYVYFPGLPHAALTAFTTDWIIHLQSPNVEPAAQQSVAAGGRGGVAIRADYLHYRGNLASSAAFIKLDRWIVKLRVSGPETRRAEVDATMTALLAGLRFNGPLQPRPAAPFDLVDCADPPTVPAHLLPESQSQVMEDGITAVMDGGGEEAVNREGRHVAPLPARVGQRWCRPVTIRIGESSRRILRPAAASASEGGFGGRTVLLAPVNDAGTIFEQVEFSNHHYVLYYHTIGRTAVLGSYDGPLADAQLADIMTGADNDGGRVRAAAQHLTNGNTDFTINVGPDHPQPHHN